MADKARKAAIKEGGKKGVDMVGMSDLGGVKFYTTTVETPGEDWELLDAVLEGMNDEPDESGEERKGGAKNVGKILLSAGDKKVLILCHVPKELAEEKAFDTKAWFNAVADACGATITKEEGDIIKGEALGDADKGLFALKMRDAGQQAGFSYLKKSGLIPESDDDDYIPDPEAAGIEW